MKIVAVIILIVVLFNQSAFTQIKTKKELPLFNSKEILNLRLEVSMDSIIASGGSEKLRFSALLILKDPVNPSDTFHIQLSKRGHFRKFPNICDFPPVRYHFKKKEIANTVFDGLDKIKLVTHCQNNTPEFGQYVIQEYLIYQSYNLLTSYSFRTRLARIHYVDVSHVFPEFDSYTFFIENPGDLAERIDGNKLDVKYIYNKNLDQRLFALTAMFQFMMINQDWSTSLSHNIELYALKPDYRMIAIPFDFDMCGVIAIPYKSPTVPFKKGEKPQRNFLVHGLKPGYYQAAIDTINAHKDEIIRLFSSSSLLSQENKNNILNHLHDYFELISNKAFVKEVIMKKE